jgi:hypothetical protein|tara:strand:+ start:208 stop:327 length:120 start_codon:yes stop_codon:yes gene_type:complete
MADVFEYFNDEWNEQQLTKDNANIPRMDKCIEGSVTREE